MFRFPFYRYVNKIRDSLIFFFLSLFLVTCGNVKFVGIQRGRLAGSRDPAHRVLTEL